MAARHADDRPVRPSPRNSDALPIGTGNKSERLLGYFTWHADDSPPINPLGDLFKSQVWALASAMGKSRPRSWTSRPRPISSADRPTRGSRVSRIPEADLILHHLLSGRITPNQLEEFGFDARKIDRRPWRLSRARTGSDTCPPWRCCPRRPSGSGTCGRSTTEAPAWATRHLEMRFSARGSAEIWGTCRVYEVGVRN